MKKGSIINPVGFVVTQKVDVNIVNPPHKGSLCSLLVAFLPTLLINKMRRRSDAQPSLGGGKKSQYKPHAPGSNGSVSQWFGTYTVWEHIEIITSII